MNRHDLLKLAAGGCLAILFTATVFGPMGFGQRYVDQLAHNVRADLDAQNLEEVDVAMEHDPALRRIVVLTGDVAASDRTAALRISRNVPGVASVRWAETGAAASDARSGMTVRY